MSVKKIFVNIAKKNAFILIVGMIFAGLAIAASMAIPFVTQIAIDSGIGSQNIKLLGMLSIVLVALSITGSVFEILNIYVFTKVSKKFTESVFKKILSNLCRKNHNYFVEQSSGEINQRINEAWDLEEFFSPEFFSSVYSLPTLIVAIIVLINTNVQITIITFVGVLLSIAFIGINNLYIGKNMPSIMDKRVDVSSRIQEMILGIYEIRSNSACRTFIDRTNNSINDKCKNSFKFSMGVTTFVRASSVCASLLSIVLLYFSGIEIINETLTIGTYFLIVSYVEKITEPLMQVTGLVGQIKPLLITAKRIESNFNTDINDLIDVSKSSHDSISKLEINKLCYTYPGHVSPTISDFSLSSHKGDVILLKGVNGSGKSTLVDLLIGELKSDSGEILFDSKNNVNPMECISIARQHPFIFNLSLKDNIILGEPYSSEKYNSILSALRFDEYFSDELLSNKTIIQENGKSLSGGQIKLIAFARCLYRNRSIIILDEIMSNLDADLRKIVVDYIEKEKSNHITLLIEHTNDYNNLGTITINLRQNEENHCEE